MRTLDVAKTRMGKATARPAPMPVMADTTSDYTDNVIVVIKRFLKLVLLLHVPGFLEVCLRLMPENNAIFF